MKINYPKCQDCNKTCRPDQIFRLIFSKKKNIFIDLCPSCLVKHQEKHIKQLSIGLRDMVKSGLYEQGARAIDFKDYLIKWAKRQKEKVT